MDSLRLLRRRSGRLLECRGPRTVGIRLLQVAQRLPVEGDELGLGLALQIGVSLASVILASRTSALTSVDGRPA